MPAEKEVVFCLTLRLAESMHQRLEELRQVRGKSSVDEVAVEAIESHLRGVGGRAALVRLTPRQREVLQLIAEGDKTKGIACKLKISVKTVEMHRAQLMEALELRNIAEVVRFAVRTGVISP
jgi:DNA-binding NarL/FixJ family response regulator